MLLASTTGAKWSQPIRVTYSIIPDGTSIGGVASNLQQALSNQAGWRQQIQRAAALWSAASDINLVQVTDSGAPIGTSGYQQGDPGFGDIRIGGMAQSGGQLGFAYAPPTFNGGTNAGDIFFNTAQPWQTDGTTYDLLTVALHEFGHALGMGHAASAASDMYAGYTGSKQVLTSDDLQGIQSVYGPRPSDSFDASAPNNSYTSATDITPYIGGNGQIAIANLEITTSSDAHWLRVTVPAANSGAMTVRMQSSSLSSLSPQLEVYNGSLGYLGRASAPNSYGWTVGGTVNGIGAGQTYYLKLMPASADSSDAGAYGLTVNFTSNPQASISPPVTTVPAQPDTNPSTSAMGKGWTIDGDFIPYIGILDAARGLIDFGLGLVPISDLPGLLRGLRNLDDGLLRITYGDLTGYGQVELASDGLAGHGPLPVAGHSGDRGAIDGLGPERNARISLDSFSVTVAPEAGGNGAGLGRRGDDASSPRRSDWIEVEGVGGWHAGDSAPSNRRADGSAEKRLPYDGASILSPSGNGARLLAHHRPPQVPVTDSAGEFS